MSYYFPCYRIFGRLFLEILLVSTILKVGSNTGNVQKKKMIPCDLGSLALGHCRHNTLHLSCLFARSLNLILWIEWKYLFLWKHVRQISSNPSEKSISKIKVLTSFGHLPLVAYKKCEVSKPKRMDTPTAQLIKTLSVCRRNFFSGILFRTLGLWPEDIPDHLAIREKF